MNTKAIEQFNTLYADKLANIEGGGGAIQVAPGIYFANDSNGRAKCSANYLEVMSYTGRVIGNGWVNYGPWQPRPGFGVIIP